ncbi:MAG: hypothetical protein RLZZ272_841 [Actinomycetota bacterium]
MDCPRCAGALPPGASFCPSCGASVDVGEPDSTTAALELGALDPTHDASTVGAVPAGSALLIVVRGPGAGSRYLLDREDTTIGRHPEAHVFLDDVTVSRRHARVLRSGDGFVLEDLGSLNGTYVAGARVDGRRLESGDELQVGRFKLLFLLGPAR